MKTSELKYGDAIHVKTKALVTVAGARGCGGEQFVIDANLGHGQVCIAVKIEPFSPRQTARWEPRTINVRDILRVVDLDQRRKHEREEQIKRERQSRAATLTFDSCGTVASALGIEPRRPSGHYKIVPSHDEWETTYCNGKRIETFIVDAEVFRALCLRAGVPEPKITTPDDLK